MATLKQQIKSGKSNVFRRAFIKRRDATTGLFESNWVEISDDVKKFPSISVNVDTVRQSRFKFKGFNVTVENNEGKYNQEDDPASLWFGHASQQRTLLKIEAGYYSTTLTGGVWNTVEFPTNDSFFGSAIWGSDTFSDIGGGVIQYTGLLYGNVNTSDRGQASLPIKPVQEIFQDYPARKLNHFTSTGMTASQFVEGLRDQTNGAGQFVFRPFFGDTTTGFEVDNTTVIYTQLNTTSAKDIIDKTVWDVIEKLAESENYMAYVTKAGKFRFVDATIQSVTTYEMFGMGLIDTEFGTTIKSIDRYGSSINNFYNRVEVKFTDADTETSYSVKESAFTITGSNLAWNLGYRTFNLTNFWIPNATVSDDLAQTIFDDTSGFKKEIDLKATFMPQLDVLNRVKVTYDTTPFNAESLWDLNDWDTELEWDKSKGAAIKFDSKEFKLLEITQDIDKFETKIKGREA